jgi:hypothetical protein
MLVKPKFGPDCWVVRQGLRYALTKDTDDPSYMAQGGLRVSSRCSEKIRFSSCSTGPVTFYFEPQVAHTACLAFSF